jgi:hypothetical protein
MAGLVIIDKTAEMIRKLCKEKKEAKDKGRKRPFWKRDWRK